MIQLTRVILWSVITKKNLMTEALGIFTMAVPRWAQVKAQERALAGFNHFYNSTLL